MNTEIQSYQFQSHQLRIIPDEKGEPWFIAADLCEILGYGNHARTTNDLCRKSGIRKTYIPTLSNNYVLIDEGNLYRLIIKSNKAESEPFEAWVCDEVLPSIRKTGNYLTPEKPVMTLAEFKRHHEAIKAMSAQLMTVQVQLTGEECVSLNVIDTHAKAQKKQAQYDQVTDLILQLELEGKPRHEIVKASGKSFNHVRQILFHARKDGLLPRDESSQDKP